VPRTRLAAAAVALTCAPLLTVTALASPAAAAGPTAAFTRTQDWGTGFEAKYTITNAGPGTLATWRVEFDLPAAEQVSSLWDGTLTRSGNHYTVANSWNGNVPAGGTASFGFIGAYSGAFAAPANCRLNGASCDGGPVDTTRPSTPTGLRVTATTSSSISLAWAAATDNIGVAGYRIREGSTEVTTAASTSATVNGLAPSTSHTYTVSAFDAAGNESSASAAATGSTLTGPPPPPPGGSLASAPYLMPLENDPPDINTVMAATGVKTFTLAFILSDGGCNPQWSGGSPVATDTQMAAKIAQIRAAGGDVMPSVGGFAGNKLGERCTDATSLANAYQRVIDKYSLRAIDFDIESTEFENTAAHDRITQAIKMIKDRAAAAGRTLQVYVTVPVGQSGLTFFGSQLVQAAVRNGAAVDGWTIMPFDLGGGSTGMGQLSVNIAEQLHAQLKTFYPGRTDDAIYRMSGISSMNGRTDVGEFIRQADFQTMLAYARAHHLARFTYWSVNRDRQCSPAEPGSTSGTCSSVTQQPWEFTRIVAQYTG
jgi:Cellulose binding domain/Glycosyl hydrolases family 18/Fibronectin type III domain